MVQVSLQNKIDIVESCLENMYKSIYNAEVNLRVAKKVDDKSTKDKAIANLTKLEKQKDGYEEILSELKKEENAKQ